MIKRKLEKHELEWTGKGIILFLKSTEWKAQSYFIQTDAHFSFII